MQERPQLWRTPTHTMERLSPWRLKTGWGWVVTVTTTSPGITSGDSSASISNVTWWPAPTCGGSGTATGNFVAAFGAQLGPGEGAGHLVCSHSYSTCWWHWIRWRAMSAAAKSLPHKKKAILVREWHHKRRKYVTSPPPSSAYGGLAHSGGGGPHPPASPARPAAPGWSPRAAPAARRRQGTSASPDGGRRGTAGSVARRPPDSELALVGSGSEAEYLGLAEATALRLP